MVTPINQWKMKSGKEMELPSGKTAELRRAGLPTFIKTGRIPNSLLSMVQAAVAGQKVDMAKVEVNEKMLDDMLSLIDIVAIDSFVNPSVLPVPPEGAERDADALYVDEIDFEDKQFLLQWAMGGTSDVETFRKAAASSLAAVQAGQGVGNAPLPPPRAG